MLEVARHLNRKDTDVIRTFSLDSNRPVVLRHIPFLHPRAAIKTTATRHNDASTRANAPILFGTPEVTPSESPRLSPLQLLFLHTPTERPHPATRQLDTRIPLVPTTSRTPSYQAGSSISSPPNRIHTSRLLAQTYPRLRVDSRFQLRPD